MSKTGSIPQYFFFFFFTKCFKAGFCCSSSLFWFFRTSVVSYAVFDLPLFVHLFFFPYFGNMVCGASCLWYFFVSWLIVSISRRK